MNTSTPRTRLQHLDLGADAATESLYYTYDWVGRRRHAILERQGGPLRVPGDSRVSFDTYFNCFFENYWLRHTVVEDVTLRLELEGHGVLSVYRQSAEGPVYAVERVEFASDRPEAIEIEISRDTGYTFGPGRVWFDIEAEGDCRIHGGGWDTAAAGRDVAASVVFCTFNREEYLGRILGALRAAPEVLSQIARIIIVNQGNPFELGDLVANPPRHLSRLVTIIEQENLGGCGGFTRGMYETQQDPRLTHFILLDDDIKVHPESLYRAIQFLRYANEDVLVGGHMLDLVRPNNLYEAGAQLDPAVAEPVPVNHKLDLSEPENLEEFLKIRPIDYNGWWLFGGAKSVIDEIGLPMPSFIRGDDIEYGVRAARAGYRTVAVPGIAVWHEPFYFKLGNWHLYFEIRNRLAMLSLHGNGDLGAVRRRLRRTFTRDAMLARYHSCQFMIAAVEDYLEGPESCFVTTNDALMERLEELRELGPTKVADAGDSDARDFTGPVKLLTKPVFPFLRAARLVTPVSNDRRIPTMTPAQLAPWRLNVFNAYRVIEPADGSVWEYRRDVDLERRQLAAFEKLLRRLQYQFGDEAVDRSEGVPWLGRWRKIFGAGAVLENSEATREEDTG